MRASAAILAAAAIATVSATPSGDGTPWGGTAIVSAVGIVAVAATGAGVAVRRRRDGVRHAARTSPSSEMTVSPDVAAVLERRTLRRGRLRLSEERAAEAETQTEKRVED
jgi:hypothetical protein